VFGFAVTVVVGASVGAGAGTGVGIDGGKLASVTGAFDCVGAACSTGW
jgi:hypothetical protein